MGYKPWLSIVGVYNYDNTIFDDMARPDIFGFMDYFIPELFRQAGELPLVYHNPQMLRAMIKTWSETHRAEWNKLTRTTNLQYDPIANYDRTETWTETGGYKDLVSHGGQDSANTTATGTNSVAAFNSPNLQPQDKSTSDGTATTKYGHQVATDRTYNNYTRTGTAKGNIGVTTTQQMIQQERDIAMFNIYNIIINEFINDFCVAVW